MKFEIGKVYRHAGLGGLMKIVGELETTMYGKCLVGERTDKSDLYPVGRDESAAENWVEATETEWESCFEGGGVDCRPRRTRRQRW